jgi:hypothetical protein
MDTKRLRKMAHSVSRREFLQTIAIAGATAPLAAQAPPAPSNVRLVTPGSGAVLSKSDFRYLGMFKMPPAAPNTDFTFSQALMTGRSEGGAPRLLMTGPEFGSSIDGATDLVEVAPPGDSQLSSSVGSAPSATLVRRWAQGTIFGAKNILIPNSGPPDNNYVKITGIHYVGNSLGNGSQLFWTYASAYGNPGAFPNISTSILSNSGTAVTRGPWGTNHGWEKTCGWMVDVPASVQSAGRCGPLAFGAQVRGNAGGSPWGANLHAFTPPSISAAPDTLSSRSINAKTAIYHGMDHPQARNTHYRFCAPKAANQPYDPVLRACASGQVLGASDSGALASASGVPGPFPVFGLPQHLYPGYGITLDWIDCMCWIDGPQKQGVLAFGQLAETISIANGFSTNKTYSPVDPGNCHVGYGSNPCCHGQKDPTFEANGPYAGSLVHYGWIYDPADLVRILNGDLEPHGARPQATFHMNEIASGIPEERLRKYAFGGAWFDSSMKRLYLSECGRYIDGYDLLPVVHVFDVNC